MALDVLRKLGRRGGIASAILLSLAAAVTVPAAAQFQSEGYKFLEAVKDRKGDEATDMLSKPGTQIVNTRDITSGDTGLHIVVARADVLWIRFLLQRGADPNIRNKKGVTPLQLATSLSFTEGVEALIKGGASVNVADQTGETPLIAAVHSRNVPLVRLLLDKGADPDRNDNSGRSARDYMMVQAGNALTLGLVPAVRGLGKGHQGPVALQVAIAVVDGLEMVQVQQQQGQAQAGQGLAAQFVEVAVKATTVGQAGQVVGAHQLLGHCELAAGLAQGVERLQRVFVAARVALDQLVLAGHQVGEAALHEARSHGGFALEQGLEGLLGHFVEHARGFGHRAGEALVAADEDRQLTEVLARTKQLVGQAVVETQAHFAGIDQEHALRVFAAPEQLLARQHRPADGDRRQHPELVG